MISQNDYVWACIVRIYTYIRAVFIARGFFEVLVLMYHCGCILGRLLPWIPSCLTMLSGKVSNMRLLNSFLMAVFTYLLYSEYTKGTPIGLQMKCLKYETKVETRVWARHLPYSYWYCTVHAPWPIPVLAVSVLLIRQSTMRRNGVSKPTRVFSNSGSVP